MIVSCFPVCRMHLFLPLTPDEADGIYYPALREERCFHTYKKPQRDEHRENDSDCCKLSYSHPSLYAGLFVVWCPHGICLGCVISFQVPFDGYLSLLCAHEDNALFFQVSHHENE
jgi:hypothetical protein